MPPIDAKQQPSPPAAAAGNPAAAGSAGGPSLSYDLHRNADGSVLVSCTVAPPEIEGARRPLDVVCVVDVSGSMSSRAGIPSEDGESDNLSRLDLVKHSVKTVAAGLKAEDRFALVAFSDDAEVPLEFTAMDAAGRRKAAEAAGAMQTRGGTQLWKGLERGLTMADAAARGDAGRTSSVLLLTDGVPSDYDHLAKLDAFLAKTTGFVQRTSCSTFGFGYSLQSKLLDAMAGRLGGMYTFIPDASIVGTAFVNNLSNTMATAAAGAVLSVAPLNGAQITKVHGAYETTETAPAASRKPKPKAAKPKAAKLTAIALGPLMYGQERAAVFSVSLPANLKRAAFAGPTEVLELTVTARDHRASVVVSAAAVAGPVDGAASTRVFEQRHRLDFTETVAAAVARRGAGEADDATSVQHLLAQIKSSPAWEAESEATAALVQDLEGQVTEALSKQEWFDRWGGHYLPSLARAHLMQQCTNFKDPGVQRYGGPIFEAERDALDDIFVSLPPPEPSCSPYSSYSGGGSGGRRGGSNAPVDMSRYYNCSGGCFAGDGAVVMADGSTKRVDQLRRGDRVLAAAGTVTAAVRCVVKSECAGGVAPMVALPGGARLTEYHPVQTEAGGWVFPKDLGRTEQVAAEHVYNLVLDAGHSLSVSGTECITLGHGLTAATASHEYFGDAAKVERDLRAHPGWAAGLVLLPPDAFARSAVTGRVCKIRAPARAQAGSTASHAAAPQLPALACT